MSISGLESSSSGLMRREPVLLTESRAPRLVEVGAGHDLERIEGARIGGVRVTDDAAADHPDAGGSGHAYAPRICCSAATDDSTESKAGPSDSSCSRISHSVPARSTTSANRL